ncbi:MDR family MFS transporter [Streptomyces sp. NPDC001410]|uniref:MDR family MFS transporter n=1 Tax=Streptomyces sp. NPDC001410 TaxID=3364574 RepID=UPI0036BD1141
MDQLIAGDPSRIGPYRLIARLGEGGMGLVYLGRSEAGRTVAVKVVQAEYAGHPEFRRRFAREVASARRVGGSWTADVLDADPEAAVPWVATQYIPGPDLHSVVAKDFGPLPEHSVHALANRLALALRAVHEAGLIHRDLKPSNVLVTVDGPRVIDFGIARAMDSLAGDSLHTRTGMLIGSPGFMSPEQVRGLELTPASDVFCLGAVLVYAATGRLLFGATETGLNAHLFRVAEEEADLTGVPEPLVDLVRACLEKDPAQRPTPEQVAERTVTDEAEEWLPGAVLAQLGRHAARLLDFAPAPRAEDLAEAPADAPPSRPDPRVELAKAELQPQPLPQPPAPPSSPPAYAPTVPASQFGSTPGPYPGRWWGLVVIALAQLMVLSEASVFDVVSPVVETDLHLPPDGRSSMVNAYALAFGGLLLLGGHLADLIGRRRTLIIGLVGCAAASALGGSASGYGMLICARAVQGAGAAMVVPSALALVSTGFTDPRERRRAFGVYAAISVSGPALAMPMARSLLEGLSWRMCLYATVPLAAIALVGAVTLVHDRPGRTGARFDLLGVLLGSGGVATLTYGLHEKTYGSEGVRPGWTDPLIVVLLTGGALLLVAFVWWQTRASSPLVAPYIVKDRSRVGCYLTVIFSGVAVLALVSVLNFYLWSSRAYHPAMAGAALLPLAAASVIGAQVSVRLLYRAAPRALIVAGLVMMALGLLLLSGLTPGGGYATQALPGMLLVGFGAGLAFTLVFTVATAADAPQHSGGASAAIATAQHLGAAIGSALFIGALGSRLRQQPGPSESGDAWILGAYTATFWWAIGGVLLAALLAGLLVSPRTRTPRSGSRRPA